MPDLSGMSRAEALNACKEKGLMPTFKTETGSQGAASGVVLRTDPVSGTQVEANTENSSVTVYISQEEVDKSTTVPNLVGVASLSEAQDLIRSAKLVLGGYSEEYSDTVPAGAVISQNPVSGTPAKWNDPVSIVVSKGAQERTIYVHIAVDETNEGGTYTLLLNGGNPQPCHPRRARRPAINGPSLRRARARSRCRSRTVRRRSRLLILLRAAAETWISARLEATIKSRTILRPHRRTLPSPRPSGEGD